MTSVNERITEHLDALEAMAKEMAFSGVAPVLSELETALGASSAAFVRLRRAVEGHDPVRVAAAVAELRAELDARAHHYAHELQ